jgi:hypothetical protein
MYSVYPTLFGGFGTAQSPSWLEDVGDDAISATEQNPLAPDIIPIDDSNWSFTNIRKANYVIASALRLNEPEATINHWLGIGRFLRGYFYSSLTFQYGDVPWFDRAPQYSESKAELDYLYKDRDPRNFVVEKNIEDFEFALNNTVRTSDGALQINRYVVAAFVSRVMLREGVFQKYVLQNNEMAEKCLNLAKTASEIVMSGPYQLADNYKSLFASDNLASNPEIIMYRKYDDAAAIRHFMVSQCYDIEQNGASKSLTESFLRNDGFPVYYNNEFWFAPTAAAFFTDRDPRLSDTFRPAQYYLYGGNNGSIGYSRSGYSLRKYYADGATPVRGQNVTDAPCLRLGEVLLNYAEICYELEAITGEDVFNQGVLDATINKLRDRASVKMPHLQEIGGEPAVNGMVYDDPKRLQWNNDVPSMLWEIRRERRVELCYENGLRSADLKRWKKLDYLCNEHNPDYRYGAYIVLSEYFPKYLEKDKDGKYASLGVRIATEISPTAQAVDSARIFTDNPTVTEGYILRNTETARMLPQPKNYVKPVPSSQITLYQSHGYILSQTEEWRQEN